jgi:hypothetical protein
MFFCAHVIIEQIDAKKINPEHVVINWNNAGRRTTHGSLNTGWLVDRCCIISLWCLSDQPRSAHQERQVFIQKHVFLTQVPVAKFSLKTRIKTT